MDASTHVYPQRTRGARYQGLMPSGPVRRNGGQAMMRLRTHVRAKSMRRRRSQLGATGDPRRAGLACADSCVRRSLPALDAGCSERIRQEGAAPSAGQTARRVAPSPLQALGEPPSDGVPRTSLRVCPSSTRHSPRPASLGSVRERNQVSGLDGEARLPVDCTSPEPFGKVRVLIY